MYRPCIACYICVNIYIYAYMCTGEYTPLFMRTRMQSKLSVSSNNAWSEYDKPHSKKKKKSKYKPWLLQKKNNIIHITLNP